MLSPEDEAVARDFEQGWSDERLSRADFEWGPGLASVFPQALGQKLTQRAQQEGITEIELIRSAVEQYLHDPGAAA